MFFFFCENSKHLSQTPYPNAEHTMSQTSSLDETDNEESRNLRNTHHCSQLDVHYYENTLAIVNGWYFIDVLGSGSFGDVYLLEDECQENQIAVKVVQRAHLAQVENEIRSLRCIDCPLVVKYYDMFESPQYHEIFLALEYIPGQSLGVVSSVGELVTKKIQTHAYLQTVVRDCCEGLAATHMAGVMHQDIKPENFLYNEVTKSVMLIDFGSAWTLQRDTVSGLRESVSTIDDGARSTLGTPLFLSPEAMTETRDFQAAALDLWALGVTFYTLVYGYVPFGRGCKSEVQLYNTAPKQELKFGESCVGTHMFNNFLSRILQKDVTQRLTLPEMLSHDFLMDTIDVDSLVQDQEPVATEQEGLKEVMTNPGLIQYKSFLCENRGSLSLNTAGGVKTTHISMRVCKSHKELPSKSAPKKLFLYNNSIVQMADPMFVTRILICEHHLHECKALKAIIKCVINPDINVCIDTCRSGQEAVELSQKFKYRLIILSTHLLDMPGLAVAKDIRKNELDALSGTVPIVAVGNSFGTEMEMALQSGCFQTVLQHPIKVELLIDILRWRGIASREGEQLANELICMGQQEGKYVAEYLRNQDIIGGFSLSPRNGEDRKKKMPFTE